MQPQCLQRLPPSSPRPIRHCSPYSYSPCQCRPQARLKTLLLAALFLVHTLTWAATPNPGDNAGYIPATASPPTPQREFRGAWIATVNNIDWPSKPGLSTAQQQQELVAMLDQAARMKLNAVLFQVRPACDALYESRLEPWSEYLTGTMGKAPEPYYDPLGFAIREAHERGLELHAWFNPFRARHHAIKSEAAARHITRTRPAWIRSYGKYQWLDPADPAVADYSLRVILDVVQRYDIDGVHLDDYFYPYPEKDSKGRAVDFPDNATYKKYRVAGGGLFKEDWRREQVNQFIRRLYSSTKAVKPWLKVGISPFGIWRPKNPPSIEGLDAFATLYADSRKWLQSGWLDYSAPQLYWPINAPGQSFPTLLKWWTEQNPLQRHIWPGLNTANVGSKYSVGEIMSQIEITRKQLSSDGHIHWSIRPLLQNRQTLADQLAASTYPQRAIIPAIGWSDNQPPDPPTTSMSLDTREQSLVFSWEDQASEAVALWLIQARYNGTWHSDIYPGHYRNCSFTSQSRPEMVSAIAIDRAGNLSNPTVLALASIASIASKSTPPARPAATPTTTPAARKSTPPTTTPTPTPPNNNANTRPIPSSTLTNNVPPSPATTTNTNSSQRPTHTPRPAIPRIPTR